MIEYECFKWPFTAIVSGPTRSGKTQLVKKIIMSDLIQPEVIIWCYGVYQKTYDELLGRVVLVDGPPDLVALKEDKRKKLLILDDLMTVMPEQDLNKLYTLGSHHWDMSIIHITQNAFFKGLRTARINCHYLILMKNPGDKLQIMNLARQMGNSRCFMEAFEDATKHKFGYLMVDLEPTTDEQLRLCTEIFGDPIVYKCRST